MSEFRQRPTEEPAADGEYPATPFQLSMLFHSLADPGGGFYVQQLLCFLREDLSPELLRDAWTAVAARHEALRTAFAWDGAQPRQRVASSVALPWREEVWTGDWSALPERFLAEDRRKGFDLSRPPLMRLTLLSRDATDHCLVWTFHHAVIDGWSMTPLLAEVFGLYDALRVGGAYRAPPTRPFHRYVGDLEAWDPAGSRRYWTEALAGLGEPKRLRLPSPRRGRPPSIQPGVVESTLDEGSSAALRALGKAEGFNLNTACQAAWALVLARYSGADDVVFGVTRADRREERDGPPTIGVAMHVQPFRAPIPAGTPVVDWLKALRARWEALGPHIRTPMALIRDWCGLPRGRPPFETVMSFEFAPLDARVRKLPGNWETRRFEIYRRSSVPITFLAYDEPSLRLVLEFDQAVIDHDTAHALLAQMGAFLERLAADPTLTTDELGARVAPLTPTPGRRLRVAPAEGDEEGWVMAAIARQIAERPEAPAAISEGRTLSYGELGDRAARLAARLRAEGVGRGSIVGLYADRSLDAVAGVVGVMMAGAAYLPLDPAYPPERTAYMVRNAGCTVVLTGETTGETVPFSGVTTIGLGEAQRSGPADPGATPAGGDLAYVIYTSGSTGRPKGVMVSHANLDYSTRARLDYYRRPVGSYLLLSSLAFDSSVAGLFWTLCTGGRLILPPVGGERDPALLAELIRREQVSHLLGVPSLYRLLLESDAEALASLETVIVAGEACPPILVDEHLARAPHAALYNEYGPTEATVWCAVHHASTPPTGPRTPVGRPIPGARLLLLDGGTPAPQGREGEICVAGPGVAVGYLNEPELTARAFVQDGAHGRIYRTGDLGRMTADGSLDLIGRIDQQVKIRGHRIELAEVEAALTTLPRVREAAVALADDGSGAGQLTAYLVLTDGPAPTATAMKEGLRRHLPAFMIPAAFLAVTKLPLSPNGKLDRAALARLAGARLEAQHAQVAPVTPAQRELASIWCELLGLKGVGVQEDFFEVGGDSLTAVRLVNQINTHCGARLRVADVYDRRTIEALAALIEAPRPAGPVTSAIVPLKAGEGPLPLYIFHTGPKEVRFAQLMDRRPIFAVEQAWPESWLEAADRGRSRAIPSAEEMVRPLADLLLAHAGGRPFALAGHSTKGLLAFELARQVRARGGRPELMILFDTWRDHPRRLRVALHRWRASLRDHADAGGVARRGLALLWETAREAARSARNALWPRLGLHVHKGGEEEPTSVFNEAGVLQLWRRVEPVYARVARTYRPRPQPMRGILFTAAKAPDVDARAIDPTMGWGGLFEQGLDLVPVPADHDFTIGPDDPALAAALNAGLARRWPG